MKLLLPVALTAIVWSAPSVGASQTADQSRFRLDPRARSGGKVSRAADHELHPGPVVVGPIAPGRVDGRAEAGVRRPSRTSRPLPADEHPRSPNRFDSPVSPVRSRSRTPRPSPGTRKRARSPTPSRAA